MRRGLTIFFLALLGLALFRVALGFVGVPTSLVFISALLVTAIFVSVPVFALYRAADHPWTSKLGIGFFIAGLVIHFGLFGLVRGEILGTGVWAAIGGAISQQGLMIWCVGLGALLATLIKDKNLLIPVSIFLAGFDVFLVLTPIGPTKQILEKAPEVLPAIGLNIPKVQSTPTMGPVEAFAYVGPADFLFMAMFFIALFKFKMKTRQTLIALVPAILIYLVLALLLGPIPLLVPIGLTVLLVNFSEFRLNKEELLSTGVIVLLVIAAIGYGMTRQAPPAEPLPTERGQGPSGSASSP